MHETIFLIFQTNKQNDPTASLIHSDQIELEPNASKFAIFSAVRSFVLESETKFSQIYGATQDVNGKRTPGSCCCLCATTCKAGTTAECRCHHGQTKSQENNDSENDSFTDDTTEKEIVLQVPQVSVNTLFVIIVIDNVRVHYISDCRRWIAWTL